MTLERLKKFGTFHKGSYNVSDYDKDLETVKETDDDKERLVIGSTTQPLMNLESYPLTPDKGQMGKNRGSYNVTLPRNSSRPVHYNASYGDTSEGGRFTRKIKWCLVFLVVIVLIAVAIFLGLRLFGGSRHLECGNGTASSVEIAMYASDFMEFTKKFSKTYENSSSECDAFASFAARRNWTDAFNAKSNTYKLGLTAFSDWNEELRKSTPCSNQTTTGFSEMFSKRQLSWESTSLSSNGSKSLNQQSIASTLTFHDECPTAENVIWGLSQWVPHTYNSTKAKLLEIKPDAARCASLEGKTLFELFDVEKTFKRNDLTSFESKAIGWLRNMDTPIITVLAIDANFYDYSFGIYECVDGEDIAAFIPVIVFGYGRDDSGRLYWEIQPIGESWKEWGQEGVMFLYEKSCVSKDMQLFVVPAARDWMNSHSRLRRV